MTSDALARFEGALLPLLDDAYTLARYLARDERDAQRVVHEAYLRAWRAYAGFAGSEVRAWLLAIVRDTAAGAPARLPDDDREILVLREVIELAYDEIARVLDVPVATVRSRLARARRRMQELLGSRELA